MNRFPLIPALLAGLTLTTAAGAQGPGGGFGGPPPRPPFAGGIVTGVDTHANTITVNTPFGDRQTISVASGATISTETTATVGDLKVNDQVQVRGVPTGITALSLMDGQLPLPLPQGDPGMPPPGAGGPPPMGGGRMGPPPPAMAMAHGTVTRLNPLTISVGNGVSISLTLASSAQITRITSEPLSEIKDGDRIIAAGQMGADGTLTASAVGVNLPMPMGGSRFRGQGRQGNFRGPNGFGGGFGGPGGGFPPPPQQ